MSKHNRERRLLWKLGLHKRQRRARLVVSHPPMADCPLWLCKATHEAIRAAKLAALPLPNLMMPEVA
jgi:hypothetical protein